jgi:hypothetical protein
MAEGAAGDFERDVFISYASEDKDAFARPLVNELRKRGHSVWFDEDELRLGDSLRTTIGDGLRKCRVGVIILSRSFFAARWAQWELDGFTARQNAGESNVLLPVWHDVGSDDVRSFSPPLADVVAARSTDGVEAVADAIVRVLWFLPDGSQPPPVSDEPSDDEAPVLVETLDEQVRPIGNGPDWHWRRADGTFVFVKSETRIALAPVGVADSDLDPWVRREGCRVSVAWWPALSVNVI